MISKKEIIEYINTHRVTVLYIMILSVVLFENVFEHEKYVLFSNTLGIFIPILIIAMLVLIYNHIESD